VGQQERTADFGFQRDLYDRQHVEHIDQQQLFFLEQQLEQFSGGDMVMTELQPTRETDARVAEAMGWTNVRVDGHDVWGKPPDYGSAARPWSKLTETVAGFYTTDPALVVPMIERIVELSGKPIDLRRWMDNRWSVYESPFSDDYSAATANLAVAAALLAVWEEVKGGDAK
jgi:hypothetical protein